VKGPWKIATSILAALVSSACSDRSARHGKALNYELSFEVSQKESRESYSQVISVTPSQTYNHGAGWQGWGGLGCRVTGSAVPVEVDGGVLFATLKRSAGTESEADQCEFLAEYFNIPNGDKSGAWVEQWNAIAGSDRRFPLADSHLPLFLFIPAESGWLGARVLRASGLPQLGVQIEQAAMTITRSPAVIAPEAREANTAFWRLESSQKRAMRGDVIEGLKGLIAEGRP
jgi:hypothetical protein